MTAESFVGIGASLFTGIASLPQLFKIIRNKKAEDISLGMYFVLITGLALWIYYGFMKHDFILIASNTFSFVVNTTVVVMSLIYKRKKR